MEFLDVIDISSSEKFNTLIKEKPTLAQFFSPQCGYCKELEPEWDSMTSMLKKNYTGDILLARIRGDMMENVKCHKKIKGFPTIFVLVNGEKNGEFTGDRNAGALLKFIENNFTLKKLKQRGGRRRSTRKYRRKRKKRYKRNYKRSYKRSRRRRRRRRRGRTFKR